MWSYYRVCLSVTNNYHVFFFYTTYFLSNLLDSTVNKNKTKQNKKAVKEWRWNMRAPVHLCSCAPFFDAVKIKVPTDISPIAIYFSCPLTWNVLRTHFMALFGLLFPYFLLWKEHSGHYAEILHLCFTKERKKIIQVWNDMGSKLWGWVIL